MLKHSRWPFGALYRNELEKLWAHRGRALLIAWVLIVGVGSFMAYQGYQNSQNNLRNAVAAARQQEAQVRLDLKQASGKQKVQLQSQLASLQSMVQQVQSSGATVNTRREIKQLRTQLQGESGAARGSTLELLAQDQYRLAHGITNYHANVGGSSGLQLVGAAFSGMAVMVFAIVALGVAADRIAVEMEGGTWGPLLLHAPKRRQVYAAKLLAALTVVWVFMAAAALGFFLLGSWWMGMGTAMAPQVVGVNVHSQLLGTYTEMVILAQHFHIIPQWTFDLIALALSMLAEGGLVAIVMALSMVTRSTVFSLVLGVVLVLSGLAAHAFGMLAVLDPTVHLPLIADWTGALAQQYGVPNLSLANGLMVVGGWTAAAVAFGVWYARFLDV